MMGRIKKRALAILALAVLLAAFTWQFRPWEPHAALRPLSYWVDRAIPRGLRASSMWLEPPSPCPIEVEAAVRAIGPRAVPVLLRRVSRPPLYQWAYARLPIELQCVLPRPDLGFLLPNRAVVALSVLGREGVPALTDALDDPNPSVRQVALRTLAQIGISADEAAPNLVRLLKDPEERIRLQALVALEHLGTGKRIAIPALIDTLQDANNNTEILAKAARILGTIGPDARAASIELHDLMTDPGVDIRAQEKAAVALYRISQDTNAMTFLVGKLEDCRTHWLRPPFRGGFGLGRPVVDRELSAETPIARAPQLPPPVVRWIATSDSYAAALLIFADLEEMGPLAKPAALSIEAILKEPQFPGLDESQARRVRQAAAQALRAIDPDNRSR